MTDEPHDSDTDDAVQRIAAVLRPLPDVDASAKARVLVAIAAERARTASIGGRHARRARLALLARLGALAATLVVTVAVASLVRRSAGPSVLPAAAPTNGRGATPAASLASRAAEPALVTVQVVVRAPDARRVALVGDFTGWDERPVDMVRDPASGLWSAAVPVRPGRHVYAFLVDDSTWMRDPRAPVANDPDFDRPGSLLLVGRP